MPFGITVLWPTFNEGPYTFMSALSFPDPILKTTGWITTKLDKGDLLGC